jgi:adenylate cyclase
MNKNMVEIERKFLVNVEKLKYVEPFEIIDIHQGYLTKNDKGSVRIRIEIRSNISNGYLMSKTKIDDMMSNYETIDEISLENAKNLLDNFCPKIIKKTREIYNVNGKKWEVDFFDSGLIMAEVELNHVDEVVKLPEWVEREVTGEKSYYNVNM